MTAAGGPIRTAVILAAGRGVRLGERGRSLPKGFLRLGEEPIIVESMDRLLAAGIERTLVVTGHAHRFYEDLAASRPEVETVHNPDFACSGSMHSLTFAQGLVKEDFLLLESDLTYEQRALGALVNAPQSDALLLSGFTQAGDEVYVEADSSGNLIDMSKDRSRLKGRIAGELVGITRVSQALFQAMLSVSEAPLRESLYFDYETDALVAASSSHPVPTLLVEDLLWAEIDDEQALTRARTRIYPRIGRIDD